MNRLSRYSKLYKSSLGGKAILRQYLGLTPTVPVPLSLSHGVDFGHQRLPQDYPATEPLHWCYNSAILERVEDFKPGVSLPHPWLMVQRLLSIDGSERESGRALVIGPPPSSMNDVLLRDELARARLSADAILVKQRGDAAFHESIAFWEAQGVEPVSAGSSDENHYFRLAKILSSFDRIILPVFSSVGVFAAALGCEVVTLQNYWHCSYAPRDLDFQKFAKTPEARRFARLFADGDRNAQHSAAVAFLGEPLFAPIPELRERFFSSLETVTRPVHVFAAPNDDRLRALMVGLAMATGRVDFLRYGLVSAFLYKLLGTKGSLICRRVNMIDALLKGALDHTNFESRPLRSDEDGVQSGEGAVF